MKEELQQIGRMGLPSRQTPSDSRREEQAQFINKVLTYDQLPIQLKDLGTRYPGIYNKRTSQTRYLYHD